MLWVGWLIDCVCAVTGELGGIPSDGFDRHNWTLHLVRIAHPLPHHDWALILPPGPIQPWPIRPLCGLGRGVVGRHHYCALLPARDLPCDGNDIELYARGRRRRLHLDHVFLACECPEMVQGPAIQYRHFSPRQQEWHCVICSKPRCFFLLSLSYTQPLFIFFINSILGSWRWQLIFRVWGSFKFQRPVMSRHKMGCHT